MGDEADSKIVAKKKWNFLELKEKPTPQAGTPNGHFPAGGDLFPQFYASIEAMSDTRHAFTGFDPSLVTTAFTLDGYRVVKNYGIVRGIIVRSRSVFGTIGASLQTLVGGDITLFSNLCEETRQHAFDRMVEHAAEMGANAVIGVRYDATEVMQSVTEVLCYGTAVRVQPV